MQFAFGIEEKSTSASKEIPPHAFVCVHSILDSIRMNFLNCQSGLFQSNTTESEHHGEKRNRVATAVDEFLPKVAGVFQARILRPKEHFVC
jgi:hypothetical protein